MKSLLLALLLVTGLSAHAETVFLNAKFGKIVASCKVGKGPDMPHVYLFKQWHLSPEIDTHDAKAPAKPYAQAKNQSAIYEQLKTLIESKQLTTVVAEGCEGDIDLKSTVQFNHWSMKELSLASKNESKYAKILTSVPAKLEAKYADKVKTVCGDDAKLIKENLVAFSDARADLGYLSRLIQFKDDPRKLKIYLDGVIEAFKLPATSSSADALKALSKDFKSSVTRIQEGIDARSNHVVDVVSGIKEANVAIVFGGMHTKQILKKLEEKGLACDVIEPAGYQNDEEKVLSQLEGAVAGLDAVIAAGSSSAAAASPSSPTPTPTK